MKKRILISLITLPILYFIIRLEFYNALVFFIFILFLSVLATRELFFLFRNIFPGTLGEKYQIIFILLSALVLVLHYLFLNFRGFNLKTGIFLIFCALLVVSMVSGFLKKERRFLTFSLLVSSLIYSGYFPLFMYLIRRQEYGYSHIYLLFSICWLNDAASYFIGKYFGKRKGIIKWSPNKTVEGLLGGFIFTLVSSFWIRAVFMNLHLSYMNALAVAILAAFVAPAGDILESWIKRKAGVKDSSTLFPQMGGILDIFDSILLTSPLYYILMVHVFKIGTMRVGL